MKYQIACYRISNNRDGNKENRLIGVSELTLSSYRFYCILGKFYYFISFLAGKFIGNYQSVTLKD